MLSEDKRLQRLFSKLNVDGQDIAQLANVLESTYLDDFEEVEDIIDNIIKVKDDIVKVVTAIKKELR